MGSYNHQATHVIKFWCNGLERMEWLGKDRLGSRLEELRVRDELPVFIWPVTDCIKVEE